MSDDVLSIDTIAKLVQTIVDQKEGLSPEVLLEWYQIIQEDYQKIAPEEFRDKFTVIQDPILPMKFKVDISKRAISYLVKAIEDNLPKMPIATKIYFMKVEDTIQENYKREGTKS
ncbi:MAG: hypothetical protein JRN26_07255 [Nitrososphaerota archaeon]|jgi:hypothetical protein|nr:hypothetical protein [Nitrososphaerota archaeon]MDG6927891.1 hypothetical protein [Nitrososphaerota archaeon]MDG6931036.1 hypothetical protein [Nitrososphaerota archaeon]MDG6932104.1 hypothetical protein [Nitrososphaerota archaeon]MDG6936659.1 hypothetical protein [Nitrososphaerota archaeon]